jgi:tetratricopeptide (TPR) repeat protein
MDSRSEPKRKTRLASRKMPLVIALLSAGFLPVRLATSQDSNNKQTSKPAFESRYERAARILDQDPDAGVKQLLELLEDLKAALPNDAGNPDLTFLCGEVYFLLGNDGQAARYYDAAIALDAKRPEFHFKKGMLLLRRRCDPAGAAREFQTVVELDPKHAQGWFELGEAKNTTDDYSRALQAYEKAIALDPSYADAHFAAGRALLDLNRREDALKTFQRTVELEPQNVNAHYNLGQTLQDLGRHAESLAAFRRVCELSPDDYRACAKVMQCCEALGQKEQRDREHAHLLELFKAGKCDGKLLYCRDQFAADKNWVMALEYFEMDFSGQDNRLVRYSFIVRESPWGKEKPLFRITLGSYNATTEHGRASGKLGPDERYWHLDCYYPDNKHETFAFFKREPPYDDVKRLVVEILDGKREAISSMTPTSQGATIELAP